MIIDVLGEVIDTSKIIHITKIYQQYGDDKFSLGGYHFNINLTHGHSINIILNGSDLYRNAKPKWKDSGDHYKNRLRIVYEKVIKLRNDIIMAWSDNNTNNAELNKMNGIYMFRFDLSFPVIDLRKDGISIEQSMPSGAVSASGKSAIFTNGLHKGRVLTS